MSRRLTLLLAGGVGYRTKTLTLELRTAAGRGGLAA
jgi:hypothetical protein